MTGRHPLLDADTLGPIERAVSDHLGRPWACDGFTDLNDRATHPCGVLHGDPVSVFAKLGLGPDAAAKFEGELRGLRLLRTRAGIAVPTAVGSGLVLLDHGCVLVTEALTERPPGARTLGDWRSIGAVLAALHQVHGPGYGLDGCPGHFGPLPQDNSPVSSDRWADFYAERRLLPYLRAAVDSGHLPVDLAADVARLVPRLPSLCGPDPTPTLLHGDAQQHNFISTDDGAVAADVAPYYGHPELDLALVDYFQPVPDALFDAYAEIAVLDDGFADRRPLWRIFVDLACITVGEPPFDRRALRRLATTCRRFS